MKLPNHQNAIIDIAKLRDYCLNEFHPIGKDKAKVFREVLGFDESNAEELKQIIFEALKINEAIPQREDEYGRRFAVDFTFRNFAIEIVIRTSWIIRPNEPFPRLTSCYIK